MAGNVRNMYENIDVKQPRHACLRCSCLKHACLDLLCKWAFNRCLFAFILVFYDVTSLTETIQSIDELLLILEDFAHLETSPLPTQAAKFEPLVGFNILRPRRGYFFLSCYIWSDTGPQFLQSLNEGPSPLVTFFDKLGILRIYCNLLLL